MRADLKLIPSFRLRLEGLGVSEVGIVPLVCALAPSDLLIQTNRCYLKKNGPQVPDLSLEEHGCFLKEMGKSHPHSIAAHGAFSSSATQPALQLQGCCSEKEGGRWLQQI